MARQIHPLFHQQDVILPAFLYLPLNHRNDFAGGLGHVVMAVHDPLFQQPDFHQFMGAGAGQRGRAGIAHGAVAVSHQHRCRAMPDAFAAAGADARMRAIGMRP